MSITQIALDCITFIALKIYSIFNTPPIIRFGTTDCTIFWQICVFKDLKLPIKIKPQVIIDAGAYTGLSTKFYAEKYPQSKIIAIEPEESNYQLLKENTNKFDNVITIKAGLWHKNSFLRIKDQQLGQCGFAVEETSEKKHDIKTITLPDILQKFNISRVGILKLDIEGAEKELFTYNYESWINKIDIIVIETHDRFKPGCSSAFEQALTKQNWHLTKRREKIIATRA